MFGISAFAEAPFAALGENVVVVALTGVVASGDVGTVARGATSLELSGVAASGLVGGVIYNESDAVLTALASGFVGTVTPALTIALTGRGCFWRGWGC
jgi:hypothetical protein